MALDTIDDLQLSSLKIFHETLKTKREKIQQLDSQILEGIEDPTLLEEAILDQEEVQNQLLEKMNQI